MPDENIIYANAHSYRLHADKLRWTLFGGYLIIFGAVVENISGVMYLVMWMFSILYLLIVSVQHWFYNLFSGYASDCERKLINGDRLRSLDDYAEIYGRFIKLVHPAYTFVLLIISITSSYFFSKFFFFLFDISSKEIIYMIYSGSGIMHMLFIIMLSKNWNSFYKKIIKRWSNLWGGNFNYKDKVELEKTTFDNLGNGLQWNY